MSKKKHNLSEFKTFSHTLSTKTCIGIVVSEWNPEITDALCEGAYNTLIEQGIKKTSIQIHKVPGSFELPLGAQYLIENVEVDAVICLGCVIQGETRHFDFICQAVSQQISRLNIDYNLPVIFGLLTTDNFEQAKARSGGKHGNKGIEAAIAAIKMLQLRDSVFPKEKS
jgi:6,7-dimethyl-8-ribityllumazine synthase